MAPPDQGLKSEALRTALAEALAGRPARLEELLARHGDVLRPRPNLTLAAAFGAELAAVAGDTAPLLARLGGEDAAPDDPRAFLPIAAAHGWAARVRARREVSAAWTALGELAADERAPVRVGTLEALVGLGQRGEGDALVAHAAGWLGAGARAQRYAAAALAIEALGDRRVLATVEDRQALLAFLSVAIDEAASAPRSAERLDARRWLLQALPRTLAAVVVTLDVADQGRTWLAAECARARHPDVRASLSDTILRLDRAGAGEAAIAELRRALQGSAKPPRDPTRIRPGAGRGRRSRPVR